MSLYDTLGVPADAGPAAINAAYRRKAQEHHPDKGGDPAKFADLTHAVTVLRDPERRARYDSTGEDSGQPDNTFSEASGMLVGAFQEAIGGVTDPARIDLVERTKKILDARYGQLKAERSKLVGEQLKITKALTRLGHSGEAPNVIEGAFMQTLNAMGSNLAQMNAAEASLLAALEMAEGYSWEVDLAPPAAQCYPSGTWTTSSTSW